MRGYRHNLVIQHMKAATSDDEGRGARQVDFSERVFGLIALDTAYEVFSGAEYMEGLTAAARVPLGTNVKATDRIVADDADQLNGTWEIGGVRPTRKDIRLTLRKAGQPRAGRA